MSVTGGDAARFAKLIADITEIVGSQAEAIDTGGGGGALSVRIGPSRYLVASRSRSPFLPRDENGPWWLWRYDETAPLNADEVLGARLNRSELLDAIRRAVPGSNPPNLEGNQ
jgi:hypothetical protein